MMRQLQTAVLLLLTWSGAAAQPAVLKVEPPFWWAGHSWDPVRLLITGHGLDGARVESRHPGVRVGLVRVAGNGDYLFVNLHVAREAATGPVPLEVVTAADRVRIPFSLAEPLARRGRFQGFSGDDVVYLLMPDRFANGDISNDNPPESPGLFDRNRARYYHGGDLQGVIDRLPYLEDLGVTALWMNPVYDNNNRLNDRETYGDGPITDYHGYGAVDFYAVEERFGNLALFRELVERAHELGIKVIMDQVANHTGPYHPWVGNPPTPTWFNGSETDHLENIWQTWTLNDPYATDATRRETLSGWFIDILPDLNQDDEEVSHYLIQNSLWWIGATGIDAIRQDTLPYVPRRFWRDWAAAVKREYPGFVLLGEMFDGDPAKVAFYQGGRPRFDGVDSGIDSLFDFPLFYRVRDAFARKQPLREVAVALSKDWVYEDPGRLVTFLGLHDVPRFMNEEGASLDGLKLAFTFLMTTRGTPLIYYGDEIGMPGGGDPDNRRPFPGGWPDDPRDAFSESGRTPAEQDVFQHLRHLTALRKELTPLRRGRLVNLLVTEQTWAYARVLGDELVVTAFNNAEAQTRLSVPVSDLPVTNHDILRDRLGLHPPVHVTGFHLQLDLPPRSAVILTR